MTHDADSMIQLIKKSALLAKEAVFPAFCFGCGKEETYLCDDCFVGVDLRGAWGCPKCHTPRIGGRCCEACERASPIGRHIAMAHYGNDVFGKIIQAWKYQYVEELQSVLERCLMAFAREHSEVFDDVSAIVPVPLHPRRYAERGFNQADVLALILGKILRVPVFPLLSRRRYTTQQATLSKEARKTNVQGAFAVAMKIPEFSRSILLVDDVYTTGSTMQECARTLRAAWPEARVTGYTLARG